MKTEKQTELSDFLRDDGDQKTVAWMEEFLRRERNWITAAEMLSRLWLPETDANKRSLRSLAEQSAWIVSGQKGYRHLEHCSPEEIHHCCAWLESQAKKMGDRARKLRASAHKSFGG